MSNRLSFLVTYLKETRDQTRPSTLEYVLGFRQSFRTTIMTISLTMMPAGGIVWRVPSSGYSTSSSSLKTNFVVLLKLKSFSATSSHGIHSKDKRNSLLRYLVQCGMKSRSIFAADREREREFFQYQQCPCFSV